MAKPRYSSNSGIFAKRGDPWISRKEGVKDFGRNPETEDAEYDFDHRFHNAGGETFGKPKVAPTREDYKEPRPTPKAEPDFARRKAAILAKMHNNMRRNGLVVVDKPMRSFRPCAGCRSAICIAKGTCRAFLEGKK